MPSQTPPCPCKRTCPRHGDCAACTAHHREKNRHVVACMRPLAKARYGGAKQPKER